MQVQAREIRHSVLLFFIIAILPMIFFPSDLGLKFDTSVILYISAELLYFGLVVSLFLDDRRPKAIISASILCLVFRLSAGIAFAVLLFMMSGVKPGAALGAGLWSYKPAILLQTLTAPFILLSFLRSHFDAGRLKSVGKFTIVPLSATEDESTARQEPIHRLAAQQTIIGRPVQPEFADAHAGDFGDAVQYVFDLSVVKFCVLFNAEGLPVAYAGAEPALRDIWAPIGCLLSEQIQSSLAKAGDLVLERFHLTLDANRMHVSSVCDMWLLVGADRNSEELEKVRIGQAVEMIRRIYHQKYIDSELREVAEESHV
jgi:hypothetical protein